MFEDILPSVWQFLKTTGVEIGLGILYAIAIFLIGKWIARILKKSLHNTMTRQKVDETLVGFATNLAYAILLIFVILASLNVLGIQTASFVAILGAAGLAIGLALQGGLANFAAGVLMLIFKPFKVGDYLEGAGTAGVVEEIQIFTTQLRTPDNKTIIIPNASLTSGAITNYSTKPTRRVDMVVGVSYSDDLDKVKRVLNDIVLQDTRILAEPAPQIALAELADSSVNFVLRPLVNAADYWDVKFSLTEAIKKRFDQEEISIPFPQQDVHVYQHDKSIPATIPAM